MIEKIYNKISRYFFILKLRIGLKKIQYDNFKELNFKQRDFINYKVIKHNVLKDNFIYNLLERENHNFNFLNFFQKLGGKKGIDLSKNNIFLWFEKFKYYHEFPWSQDYASKRFLNIIYNYDYICSNSNKKEIKKINFILNFHMKRIIFELKRKKPISISSYEVVTEVLIACIKRQNSENTMKDIIKKINLQIDENSMHRSYNLLEHSKFLNNLNEIKNILLFFNIKIPEKFNNKVLAMTALLTTYRHHDSSLPLFNGCNNNHNKEIERILNNEQFLKFKQLTNFQNGIATYKDSKKALFFDVVQPHKADYHKELSAGSLSIEISAAGEKIITNCGGTELRGKNPSYLRYSAAHSTIIINNTNISEIKEIDVGTAYPKQVMFESTEDDEKTTFIGTHNGYLKNYKKICRRNLIIDKKNNLFKGEDTIISTKSIIDNNVYHIRFHLMPNISTIITKNKKSIIIRTKRSSMWIFKSNNEINIENSIYVENDMATQTSQIVISGITSSLKNIIKWSLEKI